MALHMCRELDATQQQELLELLRREIHAAYSRAVAAGTPPHELDTLLDASINNLRSGNNDEPCVARPDP